MKNFINVRPDESEYAPYYGTYISKVEGDDIIASLTDQIRESIALISSIPEDKGTHRYQEGKWTVKELIGHVVDTERIMAYRALRIARGDRTPLAGFDQNPYIDDTNFNNRSIENLSSEFEAVRKSTILMFESLEPNAWDRSGTASDVTFTTRALAFVIAGHELHHFGILRGRYLA